MKLNHEKGFFMSTSAHKKKEEADQIKNNLGLVNAHAYGLLNVAEVMTKEGLVRLV